MRMLRFWRVQLLITGAAVFAAGAAEPAGEPELFPGDPIVITAVGEPARASEVPFGVSTITAADIEALGATTVFEALAQAPGVFVREYGGPGAVSSVSLRGAAGNQTLVLIDGLPANNHQGGDVDYNAIPVEDVERLEVISGASSALYGANATAGVVNVITRRAPDAPTLYVRSDYGTYAEVDTAASAGAPIGPVAVSAGGDFRRSDGFRVDANDDFEGKGGHLKISYGLPGERVLTLRGQYNRSAMGVPGPLSYPSPDARQKDDFITGYAGFRGPLTEAISADGQVFHKFQRRSYVNPDPVFPADDLHRNAETGGRLTTFYQLLTWNRLAVGGEYELQRTDSTAIGDRDGRNRAAFAQEDLRLGRANVVAGCRYDAASNYGDALSPRAGIRYRFTDVVSARAAVGRGFRAPTFDELFWPDTGFGGGNPNLKPEYSWSYEAGPAFNWREGLKLELTYFRSVYDGLISGWPPQNVDRAVIQGLEGDVAAAPVRALPALTCELAATYLASEDLNTGEQLDYRPAFTGFAAVSYDRPFADGAMALKPTLSAEVVGRRQYDAVDPATFETYKAWLAGYVLLNARLAYRLYYPEFYIAAKNLAGKQYQVMYDYPMPGRTFVGGVSLTL